MFYCNTHNLGVNPSLAVNVNGNTCRRRSDHISDLQVLGCKLHKNVFGGRALPGPAGELLRSPKFPSRYKEKGR